MTTQGRRSRVVVGVDGSPDSARALLYAAGEARRRRAQLVVVTAVFWDNPGIELIHPTGDQLRTWGSHLLDLAVAEAGLAHDDPPVEKVVAEGDPAQVLVDQGIGAASLVVGHRGRGALRSALVGSVSLRCVLHAPCPVIVVPPPGPDAHGHRRWPRRRWTRGPAHREAPR